METKPKVRILLLFTLLFCLSVNATEKIEGHEFVTSGEYHKLGKPCACPSDPAKNGVCGRRAALCRTGGYNILDCGNKSVKSIEEYKMVQKELCGTDF